MKNGIYEEIINNKILKEISNEELIIGKEKLDSEDAKILALLDGKKYLTIHNKVDLSEKNRTPSGIYTSCKTLEGVDEIKNAIYNMVVGGDVVGDELIITNSRHKDCLVRAKRALLNVLGEIDNTTLDACSVDLHEAYSALGAITGETSNESILDSVFSKFCLGK